MRGTVLAVLALASATQLRAQSVDEIIAKYQQRIGGADKIQAIQSIRRTGKYYGGGGFEAEVKYESKRPNKIREEFTFGGMTGVNAWDGKGGWKIEPWQGKKDPESLSEDEIKGIVAIRRQGRSACVHVRELVSRKAQEMDERLKDLTEIRNSLRDLLHDWRPSKECNSKICPKIEGGRVNEPPEDVSVPSVHRVPGSRGRQRGRRGKDR